MSIAVASYNWTLVELKFETNLWTHKADISYNWTLVELKWRNSIWEHVTYEL